VELDHAVESVNGVNSLLCHQLKRSISYLNVNNVRRKGVSSDKNLGYGVGPRKQRKYCGSYDKPTWTRWRANMVPIGALHDICRLSSVLDKDVTKQVPQHGDIQTKSSPHDRYRVRCGLELELRILDLGTPHGTALSNAGCLETR
jgi:hypothetical protein